MRNISVPTNDTMIYAVHGNTVDECIADCAKLMAYLTSGAQPENTVDDDDYDSDDYDDYELDDEDDDDEDYYDYGYTGNYMNEPSKDSLDSDLDELLDEIRNRIEELF